MIDHDNHYITEGNANEGAQPFESVNDLAAITIDVLQKGPLSEPNVYTVEEFMKQ